MTGGGAFYGPARAFPRTGLNELTGGLLRVHERAPS
jgi:hypothetical protein